MQNISNIESKNWQALFLTVLISPTLNRLNAKQIEYKSKELTKIIYKTYI